MFGALNPKSGKSQPSDCRDLTAVESALKKLQRHSSVQPEAKSKALVDPLRAQIQRRLKDSALLLLSKPRHGAVPGASRCGLGFQFGATLVGTFVSLDLTCQSQSRKFDRGLILRTIEL